MDGDDRTFEFRDHLSEDRALSVAEEPEVSAAIENAVAEYQAAEDVFNAAVWVIARAPELGTQIDAGNPGRRVLKLAPNAVAKSPGILVRYFRDGHDLVVDWVKFLPFDEKTAVTPDAYVFRRPTRT